jgi:hypothetical protein
MEAMGMETSVESGKNPYLSAMKNFAKRKAKTSKAHLFKSKTGKKVLSKMAKAKTEEFANNKKLYKKAMGTYTKKKIEQESKKLTKTEIASNKKLYRD